VKVTTVVRMYLGERHAAAALIERLTTQAKCKRYNQSLAIKKLEREPCGRSGSRYNFPAMPLDLRCRMCAKSGIAQIYKICGQVNANPDS
jgi:hypothetical protein